MQNLLRVYRSYKHHCQWVSFKLDGMLEFYLVKMMGTVTFTEHVLRFSNLSKLQSLFWYLRDADWLYRKWWVDDCWPLNLDIRVIRHLPATFFFIGKDEQTIDIIGCGDNSTTLEVHHGECGIFGINVLKGARWQSGGRRGPSA